jgi:hypothetical protein
MAQKSPLYDLDDEDVEWLKALNKSRKNQGEEQKQELLGEKCNYRPSGRNRTCGLAIEL